MNGFGHFFDFEDRFNAKDYKGYFKDNKKHGLGHMTWVEDLA